MANDGLCILMNSFDLWYEDVTLYFRTSLLPGVAIVIHPQYPQNLVFGQRWKYTVSTSTPNN